jgi:hypothetical protein
MHLMNDLPYDLDSRYKVYEGDRTQYSYILNKNTYAINLSTEIDLPRWNLVASVFLHIQNHIEMDNLETIITLRETLKEKAMFIILQMLV